MSQQIKVDREIIYQGVAAFSPNIKGNPFPLRSCFDEDFFIPQAYAGWVEEETNGGTIAWAAPHTLTLTNGSTDNDVSELSHPSTWSGSKNCMMQAKLKVSAITTVGINVGFVDADMSTDNQICWEITSGAATLVNGRVTDGAGFVFDTDGSADYWYMVYCKDDAESTPVVVSVNGSSVAPVANTYAWFGVGINTDGDVTYYYNWEPVGFASAVLTATDALIPYVSVINRTGAARVVTVDRVICWQDEL